jgi:hypothetical protein
VAAQTASNDLTRAKNKDTNAAQSEANALKTLRDALIAVDPKYKNLEI